MIKNKVLIIGFGHHARRIHFPVIDQLPNAEILGIVDLKSQQDAIHDYLTAEKIKIATLFLDKYSNNLANLTVFAQRLGVNCVVISTDPDTHVFYAEWALKLGYHVMMDKPVHAEPYAAHKVQAAKNIHANYKKLLTTLNTARKDNPHLVCEILTQRRHHPAYILVKKVIEEVYAKTNCPVTYYYGFHNDGQWRLADELHSINYHGFNEGYGKASHSGYHFFDLLNWFTSSYQHDKKIDGITVKAWPNFPENYLNQIDSSVIKKVFPKLPAMSEDLPSKLGEIDVMNTIQLKADKHTITHAQIDLLHSGLSSRSWEDIEGRNLYKGNGRTRHEQHYIAMGPFASINLCSWQSQPFESENIGSEQLFQPGHEFNLDIIICKNAELIGGQHVETYSLKDFYEPSLKNFSRGHQEDARMDAFVEFFDLISNKKSKGSSPLESHYLTSRIMSGVYESVATGETINGKL